MHAGRTQSQPQRTCLMGKTDIIQNYITKAGDLKVFNQSTGMSQESQAGLSEDKMVKVLS